MSYLSVEQSTRAESKSRAPELGFGAIDRVSPSSGMSDRNPRPVVILVVGIGLGAIALGWVAWVALQPVNLNDAATTLDVPPIGETAAANLADGRPVFVVHDGTGTVSVIDGLSTHVPWGLAKIVTWCATSHTFDDTFHGAKWTENGDYLLGPAPNGLIVRDHRSRRWTSQRRVIRSARSASVRCSCQTARTFLPHGRASDLPVAASTAARITRSGDRRRSVGVGRR
jgi:hypothetical protein